MLALHIIICKDMKMANIFYVGSCRYQGIVSNTYFPPRLHTTREIINFLNTDRFDITKPYTYFEFGGATHPYVIENTTNYIKTPTISSCDIFCMELCSRKIVYMNDTIPLNAYYYANSNAFNTKLHILTDQEILDDILKIKSILQHKYNIQRIIIIPHINLKLKETDKKIIDRDSLCTFLNTIPETIPLTELLEEEDPIYRMEDILPDGFHFSNESRAIVSRILTRELQKRISHYN